MSASLLAEYIPFLFEGFLLTIALAIVSMASSTILGAVIGLSGASDYVVLRSVSRAYVEVFRNVPLLVIVFIFYFGLPKVGIVLSGFACGVSALTIYTAAFVGETIRGGIVAIDKGQWSAARSLGFSYAQTLQSVILPQAFKIGLPPMVNNAISLVKDTALVSTIGVAELMYQGQLMESRTFATFDSFLLVAAFYLVLIIPMSLLALSIERANRLGG